jgi:hypothetical protein
MKYFLYSLTILFIGLKLTNYIDWSWWLVLLPLYGFVVLIFCFGTLAFIGAFLLILKDELVRKFNK